MCSIFSELSDKHISFPEYSFIFVKHNLAVTQEVESVTPETSLPEFTSKMEGLMVPVGGTVTFKCSASGYPVPKFKW